MQFGIQTHSSIYAQTILNVISYDIGKIIEYIHYNQSTVFTVTIQTVIFPNYFVGSGWGGLVIREKEGTEKARRL